MANKVKQSKKKAPSTVKSKTKKPKTSSVIKETDVQSSSHVKRGKTYSAVPIYLLILFFVGVAGLYSVYKDDVQTYLQRLQGSATLPAPEITKGPEDIKPPFQQFLQPILDKRPHAEELSKQKANRPDFERKKTLQEDVKRAVGDKEGVPYDKRRIFKEDPQPLPDQDPYRKFADDYGPKPILQESEEPTVYLLLKEKVNILETRMNRVISLIEAKNNALKAFIELQKAIYSSQPFVQELKNLKRFAFCLLNSSA